MSSRLFGFREVTLLVSAGIGISFALYLFSRTSKKSSQAARSVDVYVIQEKEVQNHLKNVANNATVEDKRGRLPLHIAVSTPNADTDKVRELLQEFPEGASIPDRFWGALPLHYAAHHDSDAANSEVVQLLIDAYPEGMCIPDGAGFLPLHRAVNRRDISVELVQQLLDACPHSAAIPTSNGNLALHWAVVGILKNPLEPVRDADLEVLAAVYGAYPGAWGTVNSKGSCVADLVRSSGREEEAGAVSGAMGVGYLRDEGEIDRVLGLFKHLEEDGLSKLLMIK